MLQYANQSSALVGLSQVVADIAQRCIKVSALGFLPGCVSPSSPLTSSKLELCAHVFTHARSPALPPPSLSVSLPLFPSLSGGERLARDRMHMLEVWRKVSLMHGSAS